MDEQIRILVADDDESIRETMHACKKQQETRKFTEEKVTEFIETRVKELEEATTNEKEPSKQK